MQSDIAAALALLAAVFLAVRLAVKVRTAANAARDARRAAAKASADTLMRAYGLAKPSAAADPAAEHIRRLARMRAQQRQQATQPQPAHNPGPGLRPHPVHGHRRAAPTPAYVIQPAVEPAALACISTDASPDRIDAAVIHSMTLPIGSWSSDTSSSTSTPGD